MLLNTINKKIILVICFAFITMFSSCNNDEVLVSNTTNIVDPKETKEDELLDSSYLKTIEPEKEPMEDEPENLTNLDDTISTNTELEDEKIRELVNSMTLEEKVGQMFIVEPEAFSKSSTVTEIGQIDLEKVKKYNVGGFIMFSKNIVNPSQITALNNGLIKSNSSLFISVDEEGGTVSRISSNPNFSDKQIENMSEIGANNDTKRADEVGEQIGSYLKKYGFNLDFAPLCDVLVNKENTVVKKRSFGSDEKIVSDLTLRVMNGLRKNDILTTAKHFPGHGSTSLDTHDGFATSYSTLEELQEKELVPFENMIANDVDMMMVSHVIYENVTKEQTPATMNHYIVTKLLKEDMGYNGVIITDAMNMGAISKNYSVEKSTVSAISAGIDIILIPSDFYRAYDSVIDAVNNGTIKEERIDESVYKILLLKSKL